MKHTVKDRNLLGDYAGSHFYVSTDLTHTSFLCYFYHFIFISFVDADYLSERWDNGDVDASKLEWIYPSLDTVLWKDIVLLI